MGLAKTGRWCNSNKSLERVEKDGLRPETERERRGLEGASGSTSTAWS